MPQAALAKRLGVGNDGHGICNKCQGRAGQGVSGICQGSDAEEYLRINHERPAARFGDNDAILQ